MSHRTVLPLSAALLLLAARGPAQEPQPAPSRDRPKVHRATYAVRHGDPASLAEVVARHFKGDADALAAPTGAGGAVLVSGSEAAVADAVKLLGQLDAKPRAVEVEVTVAEVPAPKDPAAPAALVAAVAGAKDPKALRFTLTTVEGQTVSTTTGGNRPLVTGVAAGAGRPIQKSVTYQSVGTTVKVTPRLVAGGDVAVDLSVQDTRVRGAEGDADVPPGIDTNTLATRLLVPAGRAVAAQAVRAEGKAGPTVAVVVVTARVVEVEPAGVKPR